ncbi:hypothetical protein [Streptomyces sp. NPDC012888]|uniref:hypothetical protein n=1 Tax=Streptomyces sp. NPDC012888 TaxID=3364855 RepID=UPI0036844CCC
MEIFDPADPVSGPDQTAEPELRSGPLWRHALWAVAVTAAGMGLGWLAALYRLGPDEYGIPSAAEGSPWALLAVCAAAGLTAAALLRGTAARIPLYAPTRVCGALVFAATRLALGFRPEPALLAAGAAAVVAAAAAWCAFGVVTHRRDATSA